MKIIKVNGLTPIQSGMLFQYMLSNDKSSYMGTEIFELEGNINSDILRAYWIKFQTNTKYSAPM